MTGTRTPILGPVLTIVTAALALAGCGSPDSAIHEPTPTPEVRVPNETGAAGRKIAFADGMRLRVTDARTARTIGTETPQRARGRFVVVKARAVDRTGQDVSIGKSDIRLRDGAGKWHAPFHRPAVEAFGQDVFLDYEEVPEYTPPGLSRGGDSAEIADRYSHQGYLVFDVPQRAARGSVLEIGYSRYDEGVGDPDEPEDPTGAKARIRLGV